MNGHISGRTAALVSILIAWAVAACNTPPPHAAPGKKMKLETITHDWQTTYVYREVDDPKPAAVKR